jgi:hypothetical protein
MDMAKVRTNYNCIVLPYTPMTLVFLSANNANPARSGGIRDIRARTVERNPLDIHSERTFHFSENYPRVRLRFDLELHNARDLSTELSTLFETWPNWTDIDNFTDFGFFHEQPGLTDTEVDTVTETFDFPESKQGYCAIDQEEITHGDACRRIKQVHTSAACIPTEI